MTIDFLQRMDSFRMVIGFNYRIVGERISLLIHDLAEYCLAKHGATENYPFGDDVLVIKVATKMFALLATRNDQPAISLKCDPYIAESLRQQHASIIPGYHLNKTHWNTILIDGSILEGEIRSMIDHSYDLVYRALKKSEREGIDRMISS